MIARVANPDRLTALDTSFLHLETRRRAHARRVGDDLRGRAARPTRSSSSASRAGCTSCPATASGSRACRSARAGPSGSTTRTSTPATTSATPRCPRPGSDARARSAGRARSSPSAWTAPSRCGRSGSSRASSGDRFALIAKTHHALVDGVSRRGHHDRCSSTPRPTRCPPRAPDAAGSRGPSPPAPSCSPRRCSSARRCPARSSRGVRALHARAAPGASRRSASGLAGVGAMAWAGARRPRRARRRSTSRSARTAATRGSTPSSATFKAIKDALGGTLNDVVLAAVALALGRYLRDRGEATEGLVLKAMVPVSVRADDRARRAGQPGRRDVGAAAGRRRGPGEVFAEVHAAMGDLKESGQAVGAQVLTAARRLRAADDPQPGRAPAGPPALLQPRRHERARAAVPALPARAPRCERSTPSCRWPHARRWASRS